MIKRDIKKVKVTVQSTDLSAPVENTGSSACLTQPSSDICTASGKNQLESQEKKTGTTW